MKRCKTITLLLICVLGAQSLFAQIRQVTFEQLDSLQKSEKRPVVVFLHTSWCKYCTAMKNTTFKNKEVQALLNQSFYFVSFDAEEKRAKVFRGHSFKFRPAGPTTGIHELAEQFHSVNGTSAYPGTFFLNADYEIIYQREGFIQKKEFLDILKKVK
jgi:thioredoxin-related protein